MHVEYDVVVSSDFLTLTARQAAPTNDTLSAQCSNDGAAPENNLRAVAASTVRVRRHAGGPDAVAAGMIDDQSLVIEEHAFLSGVPACVNALLPQQSRKD